MTDSDVYLLSAVQHSDPVQALRQALDSVDLPPARVQDLLFGLDAPFSTDFEQVKHKAGLSCPSAVVNSSLRAVFFAAQSILSGDAELVGLLGLDETGCSAFMLASPEAVGRWNLLPRARLAARSLSGPEAALRTADLAAGQAVLIQDGLHGASLLKGLVEELEKSRTQWGLVSVSSLALLVERL